MASDSKQPWFKFYTSEWISGVGGLSAAERGVYVTLLAMMYDKEAPIDRDDTRLARSCGLPKAGFTRCVESLIGLGKIIERDGTLWNERAESVLSERENRKLMASDAANSRWEKHKKKQRKKNASAVHEQCEPNATRARVSEARILLDESNNKDLTKETVETVLLGAVSPETVSDLLAHRKAKREPLTLRAAKIAVEEMRKHGDPEACAREWILRGWRGFKAEWMRPDQRAGPQSQRPEKPYNPTYGELLDALRNQPHDDETSGHDGGASCSDAADRDFSGGPAIELRAIVGREALGDFGKPLDGSGDFEASTVRQAQRD